MAIVPTIIQSLPAVFGQDTPFVLSVQNTGGSAVVINTAQVGVNSPSAVPSTALPYNLGAIVPSLASGAGGSVATNIPGNSTAYFSFGIQFFGHAFGGGLAKPVYQFQVGATVTDSNGVNYPATAIDVNLNRPIYGVLPGGPPGPAPLVGQLDFSVPYTSSLSL